MFSNYEIIDISPEISEETCVYPGDTPFRRRVTMDTKKGEHLTLSVINTTLHLTSHADAPNHYHRDGVGISERSLNHYIGPCQVFDMKVPRGARIQISDLKGEAIRAQRVLFKTNSFTDGKSWCNDYNSLSPELINYLASKKVILAGIDTPSVDPDDSKDLESHQTVFKNDFAILEGLYLKDVPAGDYFLIAAPLKIKDADASPVRATLLKFK